MSTPSERFVVNGTVALAVREYGDPANPTVVLVHGYPDTSAVWDGVVAQLHERFHVVTYDVRGFGRSTPPMEHGGYDIERLADDLRAVIDATSGGRPVHLVGHDWGSVQSWEAVVDPAFRSRLASFTTVSGPCLDHIGSWVRSRLRRPSPRAIAQLLAQAVRSSYVAFFHIPLVSTVPWHLGLARAFRFFLRRVEGVPVDASHPAPTLPHDGSIGVRLYRANVRRRTLRPRPATTDVPVQLVVPTRDKFLSTSIYADLDQKATTLVRTKIAATHWVPMTEPYLLAQLIADFVNANQSRRRLVAAGRGA